jgi:hypothetical protein
VRWTPRFDAFWMLILRADCFVRVWQLCLSRIAASCYRAHDEQTHFLFLLHAVEWRSSFFILAARV